MAPPAGRLPTIFGMLAFRGTATALSTDNASDYEERYLLLAGLYNVQVTNNAGTSYDPATCITPAAIATYVNLWYNSVTTGTLAADWNKDLTVTPADLAAYVSWWFATLSSGLTYC